MCTRDFLHAIEHPSTNNYCCHAHPPIPSSNTPSIIIYYDLEHTIQAYNNNQYSITTQKPLTKPRTRVGNVSPEIPKLVGIDHQASRCTRSPPNSRGLGNMQMERGRQELRVAANRASIGALHQKLSRSEIGVGGMGVNSPTSSSVALSHFH
ncbi:hypothetical protein PIB30_042392 [Stylosanthes scabra]|uniref:Uncharacterized protein n=1 Tax=Stylosanthes scabra TaxID=79078 RepID=A0ABU6XGH6_9FABA|nr:hypothetical protein [Stylosanthes scabra]